MQHITMSHGPSIAFLGQACLNNPTKNNYALIIKKRSLALGPFTSQEAEYAAMDYYDTAVTGASVRDEVIIAELLPSNHVKVADEA